MTPSSPSCIELDPAHDGPTLARTRARGERLLTRALAQCGQLHTLPMTLLLSHRSEWDFVGVAATETGHEIEATVKWLDHSDDDMIVGVFLHEIAHAVYQDCHFDYNKRLAGLMALPFACIFVALLGLGGWMPLPFVQALVVLLMMGSGVVLIGRMLLNYRNELRADGYAAQWGQAEGLERDLIRTKAKASFTHPPLAWRRAWMQHTQAYPCPLLSG